jgi:hypothetical protein
MDVGNSPLRETQNMIISNYCECALSGVGVVPGNFLIHLVFFPAAYLLAGEEFGVVAAVDCINAIA